MSALVAGTSPAIGDGESRQNQRLRPTFHILRGRRAVAEDARAIGLPAMEWTEPINSRIVADSDGNRHAQRPPHAGFVQVRFTSTIRAAITPDFLSLAIPDLKM